MWEKEHAVPWKMLTPQSGASIFTLDFLRGTRRGPWAGAELGCHFVEGRVENFRQLWFLEQPDPKVPHRKVPSKTAILVRIRFRCCN